MQASEWAATLALPVTPERDHIRGPAHAPTVLLEYGDYECPFCRAAHQVVTAVRAQLQDRVCFVYRHFPLTTIHPHAQAASEAAEAAGSQGRFWPMHDLLYSIETPLSANALTAAAASLGLDLSRFRDELARHVHVPRIKEDFMSGVRSGVNGTPTFFINGVRHNGPWDLPSLLSALEARLPPPKISAPPMGVHR